MTARPLTMTKAEMAELLLTTADPKLELVHVGRLDAVYRRTGDVWYLLDPTQEDLDAAA